MLSVSNCRSKRNRPAPREARSAIARSQEGEIRWEDSDNDVWLVIEYDGLPNHVRIGSKSTLPESMTQHHDLIVSGLFLIRQKRSTDGRLDSEEVEKICRSASPN